MVESSEGLVLAQLGAAIHVALSLFEAHIQPPSHRPISAPTSLSIIHLLRHPLIPHIPLSSIKRLLPPTRTQTPLLAALEPGLLPQIIALARAEVEELVGHGAGDGVVALVFCGGAAEAVAGETGGRGLGVRVEGLVEYWEEGWGLALRRGGK